METLRIGNKGDTVKQLQELLNNKGFNLIVDGNFGARTEATVREWQRNLSLTVDGVVGARTWKSLGITTPAPPQEGNTGITTFSLAKDGETQLTDNFKVKEFRCFDKTKVIDEILIDVEFVKNYLQKVREHFNKSITITSGYRTLAYNNRIKKPPLPPTTPSGSRHIVGDAIDFSVRDISPLTVAKYCETLNPSGLILYKKWVHIDNRANNAPQKARWWALDSSYTGNKIREVKTFQNL